MLKPLLLLSKLLVLMMVVELVAAADVIKWNLPGSSLYILFSTDKKTHI